MLKVILKTFIPKILCLNKNGIIEMNKSLVFGGVLSILAGLLHIAIIIGGPDWYRLFGAGEDMATLTEQGSWIPGIVTFCVFCILFIWGLYAFSGAGVIKRLPLLKLALASISIIFIFRGGSLIPLFIIEPETVDSLLIWSSIVSLIIGLAYAYGTKQVWSRISVK